MLHEIVTASLDSENSTLRIGDANYPIALEEGWKHPLSEPTDPIIIQFGEALQDMPEVLGKSHSLDFTEYAPGHTEMWEVASDVDLNYAVVERSGWILVQHPDGSVERIEVDLESDKTSPIVNFKEGAIIALGTGKTGMKTMELTRDGIHYNTNHVDPDSPLLTPAFRTAYQELVQKYTK